MRHTSYIHVFDKRMGFVKIESFISDSLSEMDLSNICPRSAILFIVQIIAILTIVVCGIVNLTLYKGKEEVWLILVSGAIGYIFPNPTLKKRRCET